MVIPRTALARGKPATPRDTPTTAHVAASSLPARSHTPCGKPATEAGCKALRRCNAPTPPPEPSRPHAC
eukprot:8316026-Alexandrium_andersonii.AAC.1